MEPAPQIKLVENGRSKYRSGFSMIELLIVMGIIAILVSIGVTISQGVTMRADIARAKSEMSVIAAKLSLFKNRYKDYPRTNSATGGEGVALTEALLGRYILVRDNEGKLINKSVDDRFAKPMIGIELEIDGEPGDELILDPWGNPYYYRYEEPYQMGADGENVGGKWESPGFILISAGPDGFYSGSSWQQGFDEIGINDRNGELDVDDHLDHPDNIDNIIFGID